jgi:hypothetical protein
MKINDLIRNLILFFSFSFSFSICSAQTAQLTAVLGKTNNLKINVDKFDFQGKCNIEIFFESGGSIQRAMEPPDFTLSFEYTPSKIGYENIRWAGNFKRTGIFSLLACPSQGSIQVFTKGSNDQTIDRWKEFFSKLGNEQSECIKIGLNYKKIKYQSIDPSVELVDYEEQLVKPIYSKCDSFLAEKQPIKNYTCLIGSEKTMCDIVYAVKDSQDKLKTISKEMAIQNYIDGKMLIEGQIENIDARTIRIKAAEEAKNRENEKKPLIDTELKSKEFKKPSNNIVFKAICYQDTMIDKVTKVETKIPRIGNGGFVIDINGEQGKMATQSKNSSDTWILSLSKKEITVKGQQLTYTTNDAFFQSISVTIDNGRMINMEQYTSKSVFYGGCSTFP